MRTQLLPIPYFLNRILQLGLSKNIIKFIKKIDSMDFKTILEIAIYCVSQQRAGVEGFGDTWIFLGISC
jgi:hypothetical protein